MFRPPYSETINQEREFIRGSLLDPTNKGNIVRFPKIPCPLALAQNRIHSHSLRFSRVLQISEVARNPVTRVSIQLEVS